MNRRQFIQTTALGLVAAGCKSTMVPPTAKGVKWTIGCFNRPWVDVKAGWTYGMSLDAIKAAGYKTTGLLTPFAGEPFIGADATPEYLERLKREIAERELKCNMAAMHTNPALSVEDSIKDVRDQIDKAKFLEVQFLLTFGTDNPKNYEDYYKIMADAAPYAFERGLKLVLKPHGGGSGASEEIERCIAKVNHPNFKIWYDAGNIIYYTGKDPLEQLKPIVQHVTGFCAKDCDRQKGDVWLEFGTGKVDFMGVFKMFKEAGFNGPLMVECCARGTLPGDKSSEKERKEAFERVTEGAHQNRKHLEEWLAQV